MCMCAQPISRNRLLYRLQRSVPKTPSPLNIHRQQPNRLRGNGMQMSVPNGERLGTDKNTDDDVEV